MNRTITIAPVKKSITVEAPQARAFDVFTNQMTRWWPPTHTILKVTPRAHIIEPKVGGRWYSIGIDDSECDTGKVLVWEPPSRVVLAWQLGAEWQFDPNLVTEVEVRFVAESPTRTRVQLEHRNLERMGEKAEAVATAIGSPGGWSAILEVFASAAKDTGAAR